MTKDEAVAEMRKIIASAKGPPARRHASGQDQRQGDDLPICRECWQEISPALAAELNGLCRACDAGRPPAAVTGVA